MSTVQDLNPLNITTYEPGFCNIGPAEIARRRLVGWIGLVVGVAILGLLLVVGAPALVRLVLVLPAGMSAEGFLQAHFHFCAGFAARGVYNFGDVGSVERIVAAADRARDRRRAMAINLASLGVGIVVAIVAFLLPVR